MKKILIVDDDAEFVDATRAVLEKNGYNVVSANNGKHGLEKAKQEKPDMLLLDMMMDYDSEGFDLVQTLSATDETKQIPIVVLTGIRKAASLPFEQAKNAYTLNIRQILEKPVKPDVLIDAVKKALQQ